jgi:hypothetical protein
MKSQRKTLNGKLQAEIICIYVIAHAYKLIGINVDKIRDKLLKETKAKYDTTRKTISTNKQ